MIGGCVCARWCVRVGAWRQRLCARPPCAAAPPPHPATPPHTHTHCTHPHIHTREQVKKQEDAASAEEEERTVSVISNLFAGLAKQSRRDRVAAKARARALVCGCVRACAAAVVQFTPPDTHQTRSPPHHQFVENEFEKCDRLMEVYARYEARVEAEERRCARACVCVCVRAWRGRVQHPRTRRRSPATKPPINTPPPPPTHTHTPPIPLGWRRQVQRTRRTIWMGRRFCWPAWRLGSTRCSRRARVCVCLCVRACARGRTMTRTACM